MCVLPDVDRVMTQLRREWNESDLIQSGLLRRRNGNVTIARRLPSEGLLFALRSAKTEWPYEIVGDRGNLTYRGLPLLCALDDYRIQKQLEISHGSLFVTTELWDAAILRALGLPATTSAGLVGASVSQLEELSERFGWQIDTPDDDGADQLPEAQLRLVVVGWNIRSMEETKPQQLSDLVQELLSVERSMNYDLQDVGIWAPSRTDLDRVNFFIERKEYDRVRDIFISSTSDSCHSLAAFSDAPAEASDFVESLQLLRSVSSGKVSSHSLEMALKLFESAVHREVVEPLLRQSLSKSDPYRRALTVMAADISRMFCELMPVTLSSNDGNSVLCEQTLRQQLDLSSRFVAIINAMKQKK